MSIMFPIIHVNGTSAKTLFDGYRAARDAVQAAEESFRQIEFNARDYYCNPDFDAWTKARKEQQDRIAALHKVKEELEAIALYCMGYLKEGDKCPTEMGEGNPLTEGANGGNLEASK